MERESNIAPPLSIFSPLRSSSARLIGSAVPVAIAFFLSFYRLGFQSLWIDEYYTYYSSSPSMWKIPFNIVDSNPPFYFFLTHWSVAQFGNGEAALRFPAA